MTVQKILPKTQKSLQPCAMVVDVNDLYVKQAIQDLLDTLENHQQELDRLFPGKGVGVGLAANQIEYPYLPISEIDQRPKLGFYPKDFTPPQIYVVSIRPARAKNEGCEVVLPTIYINASYIPFADKDAKPEQIAYEEGCLSINGIKGLFVPRYKKIQLSALGRAGEKINLVVEGFVARVHQHESDHNLGNEYLNQMPWSDFELNQILTWTHQHSELKITDIPSWIITNKLQCTIHFPDVLALQSWTENEIKKRNQLPTKLSQSSARVSLSTQGKKRLSEKKPEELLEYKAKL